MAAFTPKLRTVILPRGTLLYHGTARNGFSPDFLPSDLEPHYPQRSWFSDTFEGAQYFVRQYRYVFGEHDIKRVLTYRLRKQVRLAYLETENDLTALLQMVLEAQQRRGPVVSGSAEFFRARRATKTDLVAGLNTFGLALQLFELRDYLRPRIAGWHAPFNYRYQGGAKRGQVIGSDTLITDVGEYVQLVDISPAHNPGEFKKYLGRKRLWEK